MAGLERRYVVKKIDDPEYKHAGCPYFVLDPRHDAGARFALRAYAVWARKRGNQELFDDLMGLIKETQDLAIREELDVMTPEERDAFITRQEGE